jgi:alginate O-acetyltransferase complex protein AlgJ
LSTGEYKLYEKGSREEEAELSLKSTVLSRSVGWFLCAVLLAAISCEAVVQHLTEIPRNLRRRQAEGAGHILPACYDVTALLPSLRRSQGRHGLGRLWQSLATTAEIEAFADELVKGSVISNAVRPQLQAALCRAGAGNEKAYMGRDGWVFYRPDVDYLTQRGFLDPDVLRARSRWGTTQIQADPRTAILHFRDQLKARSIELIVLPVPCKPVIHPEKFSRRYDGSSVVQNASYGQFLRDLESGGVRVVDVTPALIQAKRDTRQAQYLATDTHWTPQAMELVAAGLAEAVREAAGVPRAAAPAYARGEAAVTSQGDVARMLRLPPDSDLLPAETATLRPVRAADGSPWQPSPQAAVLLLGDSFTNIYSLGEMGWGSAAGLAEQLSYQLQAPVDLLARNDAGAYATREMLRQRMTTGPDVLAGKKVVIWQFVTRELAVGDWKIIDLPPASPVTKPVTTATSAPADKLVVRGVVKAMSSVPRPGAVPYKDHIFCLHLTSVRPLHGRVSEDDAVVFLWSMRDNRLTGETRLRAGDAVTLRLTPWAAMPQDLLRFNRSELDDAELQLKPLWWGEPVKGQ